MKRITTYHTGTKISTVNTSLSLTAGLFLSIFISIYPLSHLFGQSTGGQPGQFLQWAAGARSLGMGKAFFSVSDDASATYWNPAGLVQLDRKEVTALHSNLWAGTSYDFISFVYPTAKLGVFGANITRMYTGGFEKVNFAYNKTTGEISFSRTGDTFADDQMAFTLAYGRKMFQNMSLGFAMKYITRTLDVYSDSMITFDATLLVRGLNSRLPGLNIGIGINNLLNQSFNTQDKLPLTLRLGASHKFLRDKLVTSVDLVKNINANTTWSMGIEYWIMNFLAMRTGFDGEQGFRESSLGLGFKYKDYGIDYAMAIHELGVSAMRISGNWRFGRSVLQERETSVRQLLQEAIEAYRTGKFLVSFNRFEKASAIDPSNKDIQRYMERLQVVVGFVPSASEETEEANGLRKGIGSYLEDKIPDAVNGLRYAYYKNPQNEKTLQLLNKIEKDNNMPLTESYQKGPGGWTVLDKKIYDARQSVIEGKYDQALMKCQEVLNLEPENVTALEIMGSAFFMMNQPDKAREVWSKVLEIDPNNKVVKEFIEELK